MGLNETTPTLVERTTTMAKNKDAEKAEPTYTVIVQERPTTKQQLIAAAVNVGIAVAVPVAGVVGLAVVGGVSNLRDRIKARKAAKDAPEAVEETPDSQE